MWGSTGRNGKGSKYSTKPIGWEGGNGEGQGGVGVALEGGGGGN